MSELVNWPMCQLWGKSPLLSVVLSAMEVNRVGMCKSKIEYRTILYCIESEFRHQVLDLKTPVPLK